MPIYLDHTASVKPWPAVVECLSGRLEKVYANPSSNHRLGYEAEKDLDESRYKIARCLGCSSDELILTSGGSESINLAIKGYSAVHGRQGRRILISRGEHAATRESALSLRCQGCEVVELPLTRSGTADLDVLAEALSQPAALISLIHVSNETGAVNPIGEIVQLRDRLQPDTAIHMDTVQTFGRLPFDFAASRIDLASGSGHKIGASKGIGWLLVRRKVKLEPQIHGGGQQKGRRSGTENPPLAAALSLALEIACAGLEEKTAAVRFLRNAFIHEIAESGTEYKILSSDSGVPHILAIAFPGLPGEVMLRALSEQDIMISTGAACSSHRQNANPILLAMGVPGPLAASSIRISLSPVNTAAEMILTARAIAEICRRLAPGQALDPGYRRVQK